MGLADKLGITKSSTFVATVQLHELAQVPLVNGRFRLKWKFKNVNSSYQLEPDDHDTVNDLRRGLLHPINAFQTNNSARSRSRSHSPAAHLSSASHRDSADEETGSSSYTHRPNRSRTRSSSPPPALDSQTPNPNKTPTAASHAFSGFSNSTPFGNDSSVRSSSAGHGYTSSVDDGPGPMVHRRGGGDLLQGAHPHHGGSIRAEPKGTTTFIPLNNHTCTFERAIHCPVSIPLRSNGGSSKLVLQPSPVRLAIRQELPSNYDAKKEEHKTGEIELDLSQFVSVGKGVEPKARRYLLRHSATNATLRITVRMEFVGGESDFVAPPFKNAGQTRGKPSLGSNAASVTSSSKTSLNRSNSSLVAGKRSASAASGGLGRTASSSTVSTQSGPSSKSGSVSKPQKKGWHPPSKSFVHNPGALGNSHASNELSPADLIDSLFNPPSHPHRTKAAAALRRAQTETAAVPQLSQHRSSDDTLDDESEHESSTHLSPDNSLSFSKQPARPKLVANVKSGETVRNSAPPSFAVGFGMGSTPTSTPKKPEPPSRSSTYGMSSSSSSGSIMQHPVRQASYGSAGTGTSSRPLSVRWGDDTPPASSSSSPQGLGLSTATTPNSRPGSLPSRPSSLRMSSSGTVPSLKHESSNGSLRSGSSLRFASENSTPSKKEVRKTPSGVSFSQEKSSLSRQVSTEELGAQGGGGGGGSGPGAGGIQWNQSWSS